MASQTEIRKCISEQIVAALEQGSKPWRKPWSAGDNCGYPSNISSKKLYRGINPLLLELSAQKHGFSSKWWGTFKQWQAIGGQVQKRPNDVPSGEWGTRVIFYKPIKVTKKTKEGNDKESTFPILREYTVFAPIRLTALTSFVVVP